MGDRQPIIVSASHGHSEAIANYAVLTVLRDIQSWVSGERHGMGDYVYADRLEAYLYTLMVKAGGFDDGEG